MTMMTMMTTELCTIKEDRIVFHFNKAHLKDKSIPMWVIKHKGKTYYVNHVNSTVGFSTKETPDNEHTQGSLQFRGCITINVFTTNGIETREALIESEAQIKQMIEEFEDNDN